MSDVELMLRLLHDFLDDYLKHANKFNDNLINELRDIFEKVMQFAYELLGDNAFKLYRKRKKQGGETWSWYDRATTTVYDPLMQALYKMLNYKAKLNNEKNVIQKELEEMYKEKYKIFEGRNANKNNVEERYKTYIAFFSKFVEEEVIK